MCATFTATAPRASVKKLAETQNGAAPKGSQDYRRALDDKSVDAVIVATPDHWHALAAIHACQAGKDVYVEKPPSHNCWEGRKMVEAARKYKRIVQVGTQNRRPLHHRREEVHRRRQTGKGPLLPHLQPERLEQLPHAAGQRSARRIRLGPLERPGPGSKYNATLHRNWHHFWRYSSGDIINDGIHQIDLARLVLGVDYPKSVYSTGARYEPGAAESPDTQMAVYDFDDMTVLVRADAVHAVHAEDLADHPPGDRQVPLLAAVRDADRNLRHRRADDAGPARRRLAGVRPPGTAERRREGPVEGAVPRPGAQGELPPVHPLARTAQRRH